MAIVRDTIDGYVADSLYPSAFHREYAPPWTDAILQHRGLRPPRLPRSRFSYVDLGCGDGVGLIANAVAHPEGHFIGIDASRGHIERGNALIARLGLSNVALHCARFQGASAAFAGLQADYAACHGVLAWVGAESQVALLDRVAGLLRPGGVLTIGYNCCPGWIRVMPLQRMLLACAHGSTGQPTERFETALALVRESGGIEPAVLDWIDAQRQDLPRDYFPHEYLNANWRPFWASEVIEACRARGLSFVAEAHAMRLREDLALKAKWRELLARAPDQGTRQDLVDIVTGNWFRTDIYVKGAPAEMSDVATEAARLAGWWRSLAGADDADYSAKTTAGTIRFDNAAARAILSRLERGPAPLEAVGGFSAIDLLNTIDALFMAGLVAPADLPAEIPAAAAANAALAQLGASGDPVNVIVGRHGAVQRTRANEIAAKGDWRTRAGIAATAG